MHLRLGGFDRLFPVVVTSVRNIYLTYLTSLYTFMNIRSLPFDVFFKFYPLSQLVEFMS